VRKQQQLGSLIRSARVAKRLTQTQLAARCGLATSEVSEIETGAQKRIADVEKAVEIARTLDVSLLLLLKLGRPTDYKVWREAFRKEATL